MAAARCRDVLLIVAILCVSAIVCEGITNYKSLHSTIDRTQKKIDAMKLTTKATPQATKAKKMDRYELSLKEFSGDLLLSKFKFAPELRSDNSDENLVTRTSRRQVVSFPAASICTYLATALADNGTAIASEFVTSLEGKDYGKSKMKVPDYIETKSGLQYKVCLARSP